MKFTRQFVGGVLIGLAFGLLFGAWLAEGKTKVNYTSIAGVGSILVMIGAVSLRPGSSKP
jgi:hypothetical protein